MPPDMSPELIGIIGVGVALMAVIATFAGLLVTLLLRMDRRNERRFEGLTAEVKAITQAQIRTDHQVEVLTDQVKELAGQMKDLVAEVKSLAIAQARTDEQVQALVQAQARTDEQLKDLTAEVKGIAQAQVRTDLQVKELTVQMQALTDQVKRQGDQMQDLTEEVQTIAQGQARLEGEVLILKDAILLGAVGQGVR